MHGSCGIIDAANKPEMVRRHRWRRSCKGDVVDDGDDDPMVRGEHVIVKGFINETDHANNIFGYGVN